MVTIFVMSVKMATPGLIKVQVFWNKCCDVMISVHNASPTKFYHVTQIIL